MLRLRNLFAATKIILNMKRNKCISCLFIMLFFAYFDKKNEICSHARLLLITMVAMGDSDMEFFFGNCLFMLYDLQ